MNEKEKPGTLTLDIEAEFGNDINLLCRDTLARFVELVGALHNDSDTKSVARVMFAMEQGSKMMAAYAQLYSCPKHVWEKVQAKVWVEAQKELEVADTEPQPKETIQ